MYKVTYYTGKSSVSYEAELRLTNGFWFIKYVNDEFEFEEVRWDINLIQKSESTSKQVIFKYGEFPFQSIEFNNDHLTAEIKSHYPGRFFNETYHWLSNFNLKKASILFGAAISFLIVSYFYIIPNLAQTIVAYIPQSQEEYLGKYIFGQLKNGIEIDSVKTKLVNEFAQKIDFKTSYTLQIHVVKNEQVNAFAVPGGSIVIYDGILKEMNSSEELAALLAHEVSHINHRHSLKALSKQLSNYLFLSILLNDVNGIAAIFVENANMIHNLKFSRTLENEADLEGMEILKQNQISLKGFVDLFETLQKQEKIHLVEVLNTHPLTDERLKQAKNAYESDKHVIKHPELDQIWVEIKK